MVGIWTCLQLYWKKITLIWRKFPYSSNNPVAQVSIIIPVGAIAPCLSDGKSQLIGKVPDAGKEWRQRERGRQMRRWDGITDSTDMRLSKLQEVEKDREAWRAAVHGVAESRIWLSDSTMKLPVSLLSCSAGKLFFSFLYVQNSAHDLTQSHDFVIFKYHLCWEFPGGPVTRA